MKILHLAALIVLLGAIGGCEQQLFHQTEQRTPYERYQELHGRYRVPTEQNTYGGDQPALRQRLRPLEKP